MECCAKFLAFSKGIARILIHGIGDASDERVSETVIIFSLALLLVTRLGNSH